MILLPPFLSSLVGKALCEHQAGSSFNGEYRVDSELFVALFFCLFLCAGAEPRMVRAELALSR